MPGVMPFRQDRITRAGERFSQLHLEGSFRLAYNASLFVREGLGYQLTFEHLVDVSEESGLVFRPLSPKAEVRLYLICCMGFQSAVILLPIEPRCRCLEI